MNDLILLESVSARNEKLTALTQDTALDHLNKAKSLIMAMWQGTGVATTQQLADYYDVSIDTVRSVLSRHRDEFDSDGLREIKGKDLKALQSQGDDVMQLPEKTTRLTVWTPRAALRLGMLLRDSDVAKQVRSMLLGLVDAIAPIPRVEDVSMPVRALPVRDTIDYIQAQSVLDSRPRDRFTALAEQMLIAEMAAKQNSAVLPPSEKVKNYTTVMIRAAQLGYSTSQINGGSSLGRFVKQAIKPDHKAWQGQYQVYEYEVNEALDARIHAYFLTRSL